MFSYSQRQIYQIWIMLPLSKVQAPLYSTLYWKYIIYANIKQAYSNCVFFFANSVVLPMTMCAMRTYHFGIFAVALTIFFSPILNTQLYS